jgi:hypothetical protein
LVLFPYPHHPAAYRIPFLPTVSNIKKQKLNCTHDLIHCDVISQTAHFLSCSAVQTPSFSSTCHSSSSAEVRVVFQERNEDSKLLSGNNLSLHCYRYVVTTDR